MDKSVLLKIIKQNLELKRTDWEVQFLESLQAQVLSGHQLSIKQLVKLNEIDDQE